MIKKALALSFIAVILVAVPVLALVPYSAPYTVTEDASNSYDMLGVVGLSNNQWMADNGFINSTGNDTRVETLGGLEKPHMLTTNMTLTAIPVPANSQTNLYYTTGNSELDSFYTITGYDGYVTASDNADIELGDNFTVELKGWVDTTAVGGNLTFKDSAFNLFISGSGNITAAIPITTDNYTPTGHNDPDNAWDNEANAYDNNTGTEASTNPQIPATSWGDYLVLTHAALDCGGIQYYAGGGAATIDEIDIDIYYNGGWHDVYQGSFTQDTWEVKYTNSAYSVTQARVRLHNNGGGGEVGFLNEFDFLPVASVTASGVSSGEHTVTTSLTPNLLANGSFEDGDPPDYWGSLYGSTRERSTEQVKIGNYSLKFISRSSDAGNAWAYQDVAWQTSYQDENFTFGSWIYASEADRVRLEIYDGVGTTSSNTHSGSSTWEWLTVTKQLDSSADQLRVYYIITSGTEIFAYGDGAVLIEGDSIADYGNFVISIDGSETGVWTDNSTNCFVPDNANDWSFITGNVMPYMEYLKFTIDGTEHLWYQPTSMIIGTNLPNEAVPGSYNGTIHWGDNPSGVDVSIGSMVSSSQPSIGVTGEEPASDILPPVEVSDWYVDPDVGGALLTNPMRPIVTMLSDNSTMTEIQAWRLLALALILLVAATTARAVGRHQGLTMISVGTAIGAMVAFTIFPLWTLIFAIGMFVGGLVMERSPSL